MPALMLRAIVLLTPVVAALAYFGAGIGLFLFGPIDWPVPDIFETTVFLATAFTLVTAGFAAGLKVSPADGALPKAEYVLVAGAVGSILILFPSVYVYTGSLPSDFMTLLGDQRLAYERMQGALNEHMPLRSVVAVARMLLGPLTVVLPALTVLMWGGLSNRLRILAATGVFATCSFSIFRGTDKEIFDLLILQVAALAVVLGRYLVASGMLSARRVSMIAGVAALTLFFAADSFVERKAQRLGFDAEDIADDEGEPSALFCMSGNICAKSKKNLSKAEAGKSFALAMITSYAAQGYYGLSLALEKPMQTMYGFGHSNILTRVYVGLTGDVDFPDRALTSRLGEDGWDARYQWSSAYTWFANDLGMYGAAALVGLIAFIWAAAWKDAVLARNQAGGVVFCLLALFFVYLPASNQIMQVGDGYAALIVWVCLWGGTRVLNTNRVLV